MRTHAKKDNSEDKTKNHRVEPRDTENSPRKQNSELIKDLMTSSRLNFRVFMKQWLLCAYRFFLFLNKNVYCAPPVSVLSLCNRFFGKKGQKGRENLLI